MTNCTVFNLRKCLFQYSAPHIFVFIHKYEKSCLAETKQDFIPILKIKFVCKEGIQFINFHTNLFHGITETYGY